jgi:hypothetical protein
MHEGFYCMDKSCTANADPFLRFEYSMYDSECLAGGTPPDSLHPTGVRGVVWHLDEYKEERLWLYGVCPMGDVEASNSVKQYQNVDPVDSFTAYYCYADGTTLTTPTRERHSYTSTGLDTTWTETATAFVPIWDPRCGGCVNGGGLQPPPPPFNGGGP